MLSISKILVAYDFSRCAAQALPYALDLAKRTGAEVHLLFAEVLHGEPYAPWSEAPAPAAQLLEQLRRAGPDQAASGSLGTERIKTIVGRDLAAAPPILRYAAEHDVDMIVTGTHGRHGVRRMLLGSVAQETVRQAPCPVLTVRPPEDPAGAGRVQRVLAAVDFSPFAAVVLRYAKELAALYGAQLDLLHVVEPARRPEFYNTGLRALHDLQAKLEAEARQELRWLYGETEGPDVPTSFHASVGYPPNEILNVAAAHGADLIVVSTHGRTGLKRYPIGSVAERIVRAASCPVFVAKPFGKSLIGKAAGVGVEAQDLNS